MMSSSSFLSLFRSRARQWFQVSVQQKVRESFRLTTHCLSASVKDRWANQSLRVTQEGLWKEILLKEARQSGFRGPNLTAIQLLHLEKEWNLVKYHGGLIGYLKHEKQWRILNLSSVPSVSSAEAAVSSSESSSPSSSSLSMIDPLGNASAAGSGGGARVAFMVTSGMKQELSQRLGYSDGQIKKFTPLEASLILHHNLMAPPATATQLSSSDGTTTREDDTDEMKKHRQQVTQLVLDYETEQMRVAQEAAAVMAQRQFEEQQQQQQQQQEELEKQKEELAAANSTDPLPSAANNSLLESTPSTTGAAVNDEQCTGALALGLESKKGSAPVSSSYVAAAETFKAVAESVHSPSQPSSSSSTSTANLPGTTTVSETVGSIDSSSSSSLLSSKGRLWYEVVETNNDETNHESSVVALYSTQREAQEGADTHAFFAARGANERGQSNPPTYFVRETYR